MCVCVCRVDLYVCRCTRSRVHMWSPEDNPRYCPSYFLSLELTNRLLWVISEPWDTPVSASIRNVPPFLAVLDTGSSDQADILMVIQQALYHWIISPDLPPCGVFVLRHRHHPPFFLFSFFKISYWRQGLSLVWISPSGLSCMISEHQGQICLSARC